MKKEAPSHWTAGPLRWKVVAAVAVVLQRLLLLKILLLLLSGEVRTAKVDLVGGQRKRHCRFSKVSGGSDNQDHAWEGGREFSEWLISRSLYTAHFKLRNSD
jgi:hypothetical protein